MKAAGDVLDAIGSALEGGSAAPAAQVQDAAASAFRRAHYEIDDARSGRTAAAAEHTSGFGDDSTVADGNADQEDQIIDTGLDPDPGIGAHPRLRIGDNPDTEFRIPDTVTDLGGVGVDDGDGTVASGDSAEVSASAGAGTCSDDDIVVDALDDDDSVDGSDGPGAPVAPPLSDAPSATDRYAAAESPFTGKPVTRADQPAPSSRHVAPPDTLPAPERDAETSLPERIRDHAAKLIARVRDTDLRVRVLAIGAVAALLITVTAVVSLSGVRGKPPAPAPVAAPPTTTSDPTPDRPATPLSVYQVSSSCQDSDPTAPFQPADNRDPAKAWVCTRVNGVDGNVLNIRFGRTVAVTEITIVPGFDFVAPDGRDEWDRHRLVTGVTWRMANQMFPQKITPTRTGAKMTFNAVITDQMSMTVTSSERPTGASRSGSGINAPGGADDDVDRSTAVSRIIITGYPLEQGR